MTKKTIKKLLTSVLLIILSVAMMAFSAGCNKVDEDIENNKADNDDSSVQAGVMGDADDFEAPDESETQGKKRVAITFDDGPHNVRTQAIVDELAKYGFHATFFVVGNRVDGTAYGGGKTIPYILEHGNEIGIHGYTHEVYYNRCDDATYEYELSETLKAIHKYEKDYKVTLMRPIGGNITDERVAECEYSVIMWNVDSEDWKHKGSSQSEIDAIVNNVMTTVKNGSIILLHEIYENSYQAFCIIMERLYAEGYKVVTVTELLGENNVKPGTKYYNG